MGTFYGTIFEKGDGKKLDKGWIGVAEGTGETLLQFVSEKGSTFSFQGQFSVPEEDLVAANEAGATTVEWVVKSEKTVYRAPLEQVVVNGVGRDTSIGRYVRVPMSIFTEESQAKASEKSTGKTSTRSNDDVFKVTTCAGCGGHLILFNDLTEDQRHLMNCRLVSEAK